MVVRVSPLISLRPNLFHNPTKLEYDTDPNLKPCRVISLIYLWGGGTFVGVTATAAIRSLNCETPGKRARWPPGRKSAWCPWRRSGCNCQGTPADRPGSIHMSGLSSPRQPHSGAVGGIVNRQTQSNWIYKLHIFHWFFVIDVCRNMDWITKYLFLYIYI